MIGDVSFDVCGRQCKMKVKGRRVSYGMRGGAGS